MKKFVTALFLVFSISAGASNLPPPSYSQIPGTNIYFDQRGIKYGPAGEFPYRVEIWTWDSTNKYIKVVVGCQSEQYREEWQGKTVGEGFYDPSHYYWHIRQRFCH